MLGILGIPQDLWKSCQAAYRSSVIVSICGRSLIQLRISNLVHLSVVIHVAVSPTDTLGFLRFINAAPILFGAY